jgi:hypothetical protein
MECWKGGCGILQLGQPTQAKGRDQHLEVGSPGGPGTIEPSMGPSVTPTFYKNKNFVQIGVHIKMHIKL